METRELDRRGFLKISAAAGAALVGASVSLIAGTAHLCLAGEGKEKKTLVLGIDGMDPGLLEKYVEAGLMPNFKRLMSEGDFRPLRTTMPPQSPVAWATFTTGMDPGGHGLFDFVHRDAETMAPFSSMSRVTASKRVLDVGSWSIPLSEPKVELLREGRAFWQILEEEGVPTTIFKMPANFPPVPVKAATRDSAKALSGMGTPDLLGTMGEFAFYTSRPPKNAREITGGKVYPVKVVNNRVDAALVGPENTFRRERERKGRGRRAREAAYKHPPCTIDFSVMLDPDEPVAVFAIQDREFILQEGEWSDWVRLEFRPVRGLVGVNAIVRFFLQKARPDFRLYVTPLQIDPREPALPISTPPRWSRDLCEDLGPFYTQGLPEDTKALSGGIFSGRDFWNQMQFVFQEDYRALKRLLGTFDEGLLFFYFSSLDRGTHMLWSYMDPQHPAHNPEEGLSDAIQTLYQQMDEMLGCVLGTIDGDTTLIVMSDHGFAPFYWGVNLNTWLLEKGCVRIRQGAQPSASGYFDNVDWAGTTAYALGINGVYVNLKGREKNGIVPRGKEYDELLARLENDLLAMRDPRDPSRPVVSRVVRPTRDFHGPRAAAGPDLIVGYARGYRSSWESPLGRFSREVFTDNKDLWSADHCMDNRAVPGVFVTNRKAALESPGLEDLTVSILAQYGVTPPPEMIGRNCLAPASAK